MATRLDQEARQLLEAILAAAAAHRAKCQQGGYRGDRAACAAVADAAEAFVAGGGTRLLTRSEEGDDDAHRRIIDTGKRILATVGGAYAEVSRGATVKDLVDAIKRDAKAVATVGGFGLAIALVAGIAGYLLLATAPARRAQLGRDRDEALRRVGAR